MTNPTIEDMRPRLLTMGQLRERLSATEPLSETKFEAREGVRFRIGSDWDATADVTPGSEPIAAFITMHPGADDCQLTKDALLEAGAKVGIPRKLQERTPAHLLEPQLNWWFGGNGGWVDRKFKAFVRGQGGPDSVPLVIAFGSGTISPFSNLQILDKISEGIRAYYRMGASEGDLLADYKMTHSLELTHARIIVPGQLRNIDGPGTARPTDEWSTGVQWRNSQLGLRPTSVDGYVFRWTCTNGMTDTLVSSGKFNRRAGGFEDADVYDWARAAVDNVLGGLEGTLDGVRDATRIPVEQDVTLVLDDLFRQHKVPGALSEQVIRNMADTGGDLSMYSLINAVTLAANDPELSPASVDKLLRTGGHVAHSASKRCGECRRIMPE